MQDHSHCPPDALSTCYTNNACCLEDNISNETGSRLFGEKKVFSLSIFYYVFVPNYCQIVSYPSQLITHTHNSNSTEQDPAYFHMTPKMLIVHPFALHKWMKILKIWNMQIFQICIFLQLRKENEKLINSLTPSGKCNWDDQLFLLGLFVLSTSNMNIFERGEAWEHHEGLLVFTGDYLWYIHSQVSEEKCCQNFLVTPKSHLMSHIVNIQHPSPIRYREFVGEEAWLLQWLTRVCWFKRPK